jgi:predicted DNA-binding transcriptional regulator
LDQAHQGEKIDETSLRGTTLKVYRFMLRSKTPVGIHDVQRALGLSSPSVAQYHIRKLLSLALVREEGEGYVVDRVVFDNVIRIRRTAVPLQTAYVAFYASSLAVLLTLFRPASFTALYIFALVVVAIGFVTAICETVRILRRL